MSVSARTRRTPRAPRRRLPAALAVLATASLLAGASLTGAQPSAAAPPSSYPVKGVDTSHHNHDATGEAIDWKRVAQGNAFAFLKATQGSSYRDPWFARDYRAASATTLMRAPYHFFDPKNTGDGAAQADHFVRTARAAGYSGTKPGELPPVLDVESVWKNGKEVCPKALRADQLRAFLQRVRAEFEVPPIVYTRASFVTDCMGGKGEVFRGYPLWLARYGSGAKEPQNVPGAGAWTFWQYTESERVPGMPGRDGTAGIADRNVYRGGLDRLRALARPDGGTPTPRPEASWPTLKSGQRGADVTTAQLLLGAHGYATAADGVFGTDTRRQVEAFQRARGVSADGVVGPATWTRLVVTLRPGAKGRAVTALQRQLTDNGLPVAADGEFGAGTETRLRDFQRARGLAADGVAGPATWSALVGGGSGR
ncbi:GH25 family lysozyme [Streptomyces sp. NPDC012769]|uniref:GH25 family lysozyme n=1 Tax=Streptomyces sp. NPDC012769 TaxID=3364848 RepID=UPI003689F46C